MSFIEFIVHFVPSNFFSAGGSNLSDISLKKKIKTILTFRFNITFYCLILKSEYLITLWQISNWNFELISKLGIFQIDWKRCQRKMISIAFFKQSKWDHIVSNKSQYALCYRNDRVFKMNPSAIRKIFQWFWNNCRCLTRLGFRSITPFENVWI